MKRWNGAANEPFCRSERRNFMLTRVFLAAGVAALAIAAPASAERGHGGKNQAASLERGGGGGQRAARVQQQRAERPQRMAMPRAERAPRMSQGGERSMRMAAFQGRPERANRVERVQRQEVRANQRTRAAERQQIRANRVERVRTAERQQIRRNEARVAERQQVRANRTRAAERQQVRANQLARQELRNNRAERIQNRAIAQQQVRENRQMAAQDRIALRNQNRADRIALRESGVGNGRGYGVGGCPPGLVSKGCMPPGQALQADRIANADAFRASSLAALTLGERTRILDPVRAVGFVGSPFSTVNSVFPLMALPASAAYLYPDTPDYYYRYGNGYLYEVNRDTSLISALFPLLAGGFLPGQYLPNYYMSSPYYGINSYFPAAYGFNSFYPDYGNDCYRYGNGVVYEVDCFTGLVEDVIPMYAGGYGVGQLLPSAYSYYNVPYQYRSYYYDTPNYNYWYAPGAIYQYDPRSSLITSVAALLSPGFSIGQPLPIGYSAYNVPYAYRATYYDTPNAWYRYNNGYIYQVDPTSLLVTAIVASALS
jgi:hypothetical protein